MSKYYPLGSVVTLKNIDLEFMIVSRGCIVEKDEQKKMYYDYVGCMFPHGLVNKNIKCFNNEDIESVIFEGYKSEKEKEMQLVINDIKRELGY